jgi:hypothetical protein
VLCLSSGFVKLDSGIFYQLGVVANVNGALPANPGGAVRVAKPVQLKIQFTPKRPQAGQRSI